MHTRGLCGRTVALFAAAIGLVAIAVGIDRWGSKPSDVNAVAVAEPGPKATGDITRGIAPCPPITTSDKLPCRLLRSGYESRVVVIVGQATCEGGICATTQAVEPNSDADDPHEWVAPVLDQIRAERTTRTPRISDERFAAGSVWTGGVTHESVTDPREIADAMRRRLREGPRGMVQEFQEMCGVTHIEGIFGHHTTECLQSRARAISEARLARKRALPPCAENHCGCDGPPAPPTWSP